MSLFIPMGRVVLDHQGNPNSTREAEHEHEQQPQYKDEQSKGRAHAPVQHPVEEQDEADGEPTRDNIRHEHGAVVKAGLGAVGLLAVGALFRHGKRLLERERGGVEQIPFVALGAFEF